MATTRKRKTRARKERSRKKAVVYARVSSKDQEKEGFSIPSQLKLLRKHAADNDIEIDAEYVESESARKAGRRQFNRMIADIRKHSSDVGIVLCEKTDRLHRNLHDHATVDDLMNEMGVEFRFVKEGRSLSRDSGSSERLVQDIEAAMAKRYSANLSEEVRKGQLEKAEQGFYPGGPVPIGDMNVTNGHGRKAVEIDEQRAPLVRKIFELYATGKYSIQQIGKKARSLGLTYRKSGRPIPNGTIHKILRRRFYMGEFDWKGNIYQGQHEPLVGRSCGRRCRMFWMEGTRASFGRRSTTMPLRE